MPCLRLNADQKANIQKAAELILSGHLVAFPTETVYGLGALGLDKKAIQKVFESKNRPAYNPLIFHVSSPEQALELWAEKPPLFEQLTQKYWPGPLTLVASKAAHVPNLATGGLDKVAVRIPVHPVALELLRYIKQPVVAPSANASQRPSSTSAEHVLLTLENKISAVLDAGPCLYGLESTVLDLSQSPPVILRPGALNLSEFDLDFSREIQGSPGRLDKHYAPLIPEVRWASSEEIQRAPVGIACLLKTDNPVEYGHNLFARFYEFEQAGVQELWIEKLPDTPEWIAIKDRIKRALSS